MSPSPKALVLVGGRGTRLQPFTFSIPKPLLPVGETPLLQLVIEQLRSSGIDEVVLATGYHAELIRAFCGDGRSFGVRVSYVHEQQPLGTAGPLSLVRGWIEADESLVLMNGDILTSLDFRRMLDFAEEHDFDLTVGYKWYIHESPFGVLTVEGDEVAAVVEKPRTEQAISTGIYVVRGSALAHVPDDTFFTMPDLMASLIEGGGSVGAYHVEESWLGLETVAKFEEAIRELNGVAGESA
jgi:NDP-sugar pyrophosphorylase family protein